MTTVESEIRLERRQQLNNGSKLIMANDFDLCEDLPSDTFIALSVVCTNARLL